jgi:hypothetical protein
MTSEAKRPVMQCTLRDFGFSETTNTSRLARTLWYLFHDSFCNVTTNESYSKVCLNYTKMRTAWCFEMLNGTKGGPKKDKRTYGAEDHNSTVAYLGNLHAKQVWKGGRPNERRNLLVLSFRLLVITA